MLEKYLALFKAHERTIIIVLVLSFGAHMYGRWIDLNAAKKDAQVAALTQKVSQDETANANLAITASQTSAQFKAALDSATKANALLSARLQADKAFLANNRQTDVGLDMPALASRMQQLTPDAAAADISAENNGLTLTSVGAHAVVAQLEAVPVLTDQLSASTAQLKLDLTALGNASTALNSCQGQVAGLKQTNTDLQAKDTADIAAGKANAKKQFKRGFKWGFAAGAALVGVLTHGI